MQKAKRAAIAVILGMAMSTWGITGALAGPPDPTPEPTSNIPIDELPQVTQDRIAELQSEGAWFYSVTSYQYDTRTANNGGFSTLGYGVAPCYLSVITAYQFGVGGPTGHRVSNESITGCTSGFPTSTEHDQDIYKKDAIFGTISVVSSGTHSQGPGSFSSYQYYYCPTLNTSGFKAVTGGQIVYNGTVYGASAYDGYYNYDCG